MKDQNSTKKAKKAQRKVVKKEVSKSLKDAINKHKKDQHTKKFAKPNDKYHSKNKGKSKVQGDDKKPSLAVNSNNKQESSGQKRKFDGKKTEGTNSKKKSEDDKPTGDLTDKTASKSKWADKHAKSASKAKWATKAPSNGNGSSGKAPNFIDRKAFKPNFKLVCVCSNEVHVFFSLTSIIAGGRPEDGLEQGARQIHHGGGSCGLTEAHG
jgi:hypothetical protein